MYAFYALSMLEKKTNILEKYVGAYWTYFFQTVDW